MRVELWSVAGSFVTAAALYVIKRAVDWYFPPGHHSKRVSRYAVRDEKSEQDKSEEQE